jgi:hypothetical protein
MHLHGIGLFSGVSAPPNGTPQTHGPPCHPCLSPTDLLQVRLHDLRALKPKKGQKLGDLPGMDKGIAFCTYDLLVR